MNDPPQSLEDRVNELVGQLRALSSRVDAVAAQVAAINGTRTTGTPGEIGSYALDRSDADNPALGAPFFLTSAAAVSFLLVAALILRTLVDHQYFNPEWGLLLGLVYAAGLIGYGFVRYAKLQRQAAVYAVCGTLLLAAMVLEGHRRFALLAPSTAYVLLGAMLAITGALGMRYTASAPTCFGVVGAAAAALALEFPTPHFSWLAGLLLAANLVAAALYFRAGNSAWITWPVTILTLLFWALWTANLDRALRSADAAAIQSTMAWYLPALLTFALTYGLFSFVAVLRGRAGWYSSLLPLVVVAWAYPSAGQAMGWWTGSERIMGLIGALGVVALMIAFWWSLSRSGSVRSSTAFLIAGVLLTALAAADAAPGIWPFLVCSVVALAGAFPAGAPRNLPVKLAALGCQVLICMWVVAAMVFAAGDTELWPRTLLAALLAALCFAHYQIARRALSPSPETAEWADWLLPVPALLFFATLVYMFGALRLSLFATLSLMPIEVSGAFCAGQTIVINLGALALMLTGLALMDRTVLVTALLVAVVGALKVFTHDLLHIQGIPLILSILSFGCTALAGSLTWAKWQKNLPTINT